MVFCSLEVAFIRRIIMTTIMITIASITSRHKAGMAQVPAQISPISRENCDRFIIFFTKTSNLNLTYI